MKQHLEINGHHIYIETGGLDSGNALLFLHHGLGAVRSWKEQIQVFAQSGYRVVVYDRWGHGKSAPREKWSMPYFKEDLADLQVILDDLELDRVVLVGHSDGGKIAMYYAMNNPQRVISLVLVSAHIYIEKKMDSGINSVKHDFEHDHRFQAKMHRVHGEKSEALFWGWYKGWTSANILDWDMRPGINQISCPTLVIQGMDDEHASPQHAQDIAAAIVNSELWIVPDADHMLPQDYPEIFNSRVLGFIEKSIPVQKARVCILE
jgi:pimeloyl-ACP methyl ester carboxylesterase